MYDDIEKLFWDRSWQTIFVKMKSQDVLKVVWVMYFLLHSLFCAIFFFCFVLLSFSSSFPTFFPIVHSYPIPHNFHSHSPALSVPMSPLFVFFSSFPCSFLPLLSPPPSPLVTVSLFFISKSLVLFCSFVCFVD